MHPLDMTQLQLSDDMRADLEVMRYAEAYDRTLRAEIVSDPATWTRAEIEAYAGYDWMGFSRLRGYTEGEIHDFQQRLDLYHCLLVKYSADDVGWIGYTLQEITGILHLTPQQILSRDFHG